MQRFTNSNLRLPRIEEKGPYRSKIYSSPGNSKISLGHTYFTPNTNPDTFQNSVKFERPYQRPSPMTYLQTEASATSNSKTSNLLEKTPTYSSTREGSFFGNIMSRQNHILRNIEDQRGNLERENRHRGSQQLISFSSRPQETNKQASKSLELNKILDSMHTRGSESLPTGDSPRYGAPETNNDQKQSYAPKLGKLIHYTDPGDFRKPPLELDFDNTNKLATPLFRSPKSSLSVNPVIRNTLKYNQIKFPNLTSMEDTKFSFKPEQADDKLNINLLLENNEHFLSIIHNLKNKPLLLENLKMYLQSNSKQDPIDIEAIFFDTRVRKNLKTYVMLEKTCVFSIIFMLSEEFSSTENIDMIIRNICYYLLSNFLNFIETLITKIELLPKFNQLPNFEKLKQILKKKIPEVDRSFSLEQVNKLLLRTLRNTFKNSHVSKSDRVTKLSHLLEKVEFGLMINYYNELRSIFQDIIVKYRIDLKTPLNDENLKVIIEEEKPIRLEKTKPTQNLLTTTNAPSHMHFRKSPDFHLPPPVAKPGKEGHPIYTLVLDMDETLIHFEEVAGKGRFFIRPYAEKFLKEMSELYEIVVFTAGVQEYADKVLDILDPNNYISHRLYRQHLTVRPGAGGIIKDLSRLGRDLFKTLIIDNAPENFRFQQDNGIEIISWYNNPYDTELLELIPFLTDMVMKKVDDVAPSIRRLKEQRRKKRLKNTKY